MNIALVSHSFLPTLGGAELAVHHLATHLRKLGNKVVVVTFRRELPEGFHPTYKMEYYLKMPKQYLQSQVIALFLLILQKQYRFDVIHFHKANMAYFAIQLKNRLRIPIAVTTHGGDLQTYPEINYGDRLDRVWNKRIQYAIRNADLLTSISKETRKKYAELGVEVDKIFDIPNGVDLERFNDDYADIRELLGLRKEINLVLSVGRCHPVKGYEFLLRSIPAVIDQYRNVRFLIIGKGVDKLKVLAKKMSIEKYTMLLEQQSFNHIDKIPSDLLLSAYKSSDIYVSSSLIEGFPLTVAEAMAAGLPIVATNVPGNEDAVFENENGFLVAPKNPVDLSRKIVRLLKEKKHRENMGKKSMEMSQKYDWQLIARKYLRAYNTLTKTWTF